MDSFVESAFSPVDVEQLFRSLYKSQLLPVFGLINVFNSLAGNSAIIKLAHELGIDHSERAMQERNSRNFSLDSYLYTLFDEIVGDLPVMEFQSEAVLYPYNLGLNQFTWDEIDEIFEGAIETDSLVAFLLWVIENNDDANIFFMMQEKYHWPFEEFVSVKEIPKLSTIKNRLKKLGADDLLPAVIWGLFPPDNLFFNNSVECADYLEFNRENLDYLREEFEKVRELCDDFAEVKNAVEADPENLIYLAEALGAKIESGRRVRVREVIRE